jgi:hypothetical protein
MDIPKLNPFLPDSQAESGIEGLSHHYDITPRAEHWNRGITYSASILPPRGARIEDRRHRAARW